MPASFETDMVLARVDQERFPADESASTFRSALIALNLLVPGDNPITPGPCPA